jgi:hypothetical protein
MVSTKVPNVFKKITASFLSLSLTKRDFLILFSILIVALCVRFYSFYESTYFGYDEARDAYISQEIYSEGNIKILGPTSFFPGLNHGPLHWYILGPLYVLADGSPFFVSALFRIVNALGVILIFLTATYLFNKQVGFFSSLLYAVSFEQSQYAMYVGNPSLAVFSWLLLFLGAALLLHKKTVLGLLLIIIGVTTAIQFEIILLYTSIVAAFLIWLLRKSIKVSLKQLFGLTGLALLLIGNFIVAEIKFGFLQSKTMFSILTEQKTVIEEGQNKVLFYLQSIEQLFHDNGVVVDSKLLFVLIVTGIIITLVWNGRKNISVQIVLVWMFSAVILLPFGAYNAYYTFVGVGIGVIIACSYVVWLVSKQHTTIAIILMSLLIIGNISLVLKQNKNSLIVDIKAQQGMKLTDELQIIDAMYTYAHGDDFTVRVTSMPYKVQTVWSYLFQWYGDKKYGYLPLWENKLIEGYPGFLPMPQKGTTCVRFLVKEPVRGIPEILIHQDEEEENYFSEIESEEKVGLFIIQYRKAKDINCHS